ncbi:MAG: hypothetical protein H0W69_07925 [Gemmatimonadaceae bacterium]|nr:hypothetical protein [Gemmatimonadaceae bacterium]MBA3657265.1 hypothetical protein [Gemmatimonadaceae bacterium]
MSVVEKKKPDTSKAGSADRIALAAIGLEAEFAVIVNGEQVRPEDVFGSPRSFIRQPMMHRAGKSYHLPTGGAIYFDTGVIEVATPVIEIEKGCAARAGRSLWEGILFVREELDAWERATGKDVHLAGFSTHYNISFDVPPEMQGNGRTVEKLALLLSYVLPIPVMLLGANKRSTGIGVRPRDDRIEITADFTPDAPLMIATATQIVGIVREIMQWPTYDLSALDDHDIPLLQDFRPMPHTSRKGWLARFSCFTENPFAADPDAEMWVTRDGRIMSLREIAGETTRYFWKSIRKLADPFTLRLIGSIMRGRAPALLELDDRPASYDDVGRACTWDNLFPERILPRSRYERVLIRAISGQKLHLGGYWYTPVGMKGWSKVVFRRRSDRTRHVFTLDFLLGHLREWERPSVASG